MPSFGLPFPPVGLALRVPRSLSLLAVCGHEAVPTVKEDRVKNHLDICQLDIHESMGPGRMHPRVLKELTDVIARQLSIILIRSQQLGEVHDD